jgi:hypothetical protein
MLSIVSSASSEGGSTVEESGSVPTCANRVEQNILRNNYCKHKVDSLRLIAMMSSLP